MARFACTRLNCSFLSLKWRKPISWSSFSSWAVIIVVVVWITERAGSFLTDDDVRSDQLTDYRSVTGWFRRAYDWFDDLGLDAHKYTTQQTSNIVRHTRGHQSNPFHQSANRSLPATVFININIIAMVAWLIEKRKMMIAMSDDNWCVREILLLLSHGLLSS